MKIIVDAMGGDNAPLEIIKGTYLALQEYGTEYDTSFLLIGNEAQIKKIADENNIDISNLEIVNAEDVFTMEDVPHEIIKSKSKTSMAQGMQLLHDGKGDAFISAGNSGAMCVGSSMIVKRIKGISRPGFAPILPKLEGCFMVIDSGANIECRPEMLLQFGIMGSVYMEKVMKIKTPRVGLANVGTEEHKGRQLQLDAYDLLKQQSSINFIGNIEGRDIPLDACEVVVADGFSGNLIIKVYEGVAIGIMQKLKNVFEKNIKTKIAAGLVYNDLKAMKKELDYNEYGGAPIMGAAKPVFKAHGSSNAKTFKNALRLTMQYTKSNAIDYIKKALAEIKN